MEINFLIENLQNNKQLILFNKNKFAIPSCDLISDETIEDKIKTQIKTLPLNIIINQFLKIEKICNGGEFKQVIWVYGSTSQILIHQKTTQPIYPASNNNIKTSKQNEDVISSIDHNDNNQALFTQTQKINTNNNIGSHVSPFHQDINVMFMSKARSDIFDENVDVNNPHNFNKIFTHRREQDIENEEDEKDEKVSNHQNKSLNLLLHKQAFQKTQDDQLLFQFLDVTAIQNLIKSKDESVNPDIIKILYMSEYKKVNKINIPIKSIYLDKNFTRISSNNLKIASELDYSEICRITNELNLHAILIYVKQQQCIHPDTIVDLNEKRYLLHQFVTKGTEHELLEFLNYECSLEIIDQRKRNFFHQVGQFKPFLLNYLITLFEDNNEMIMRLMNTRDDLDQLPFDQLYLYFKDFILDKFMNFGKDNLMKLKRIAFVQSGFLQDRNQIVTEGGLSYYQKLNEITKYNLGNLI